MGSPATSTLLNAIMRGWVVFPELTAAMVRNHPHSVATDKGHLNKTRAGLDSTRTPSFSNHVSLTTLEARNTVFMDLTGRFPHVSARGMEYIMCMRCSDSNFIHVEPMKSRSARDFSAAFEKSIAFYKNHGLEHFTVKLDNETSVLFRETLKRLNMKAEFIPPDNHRQNPAERDIQTFKNHFIAILCSLPPDFPLNEWDLLLPHAEMTLNLMRPSKTTDSSSFQQLYGPYDFKRNPIAPPGTRVLVYESPEHRSSWAPHGVKGFFIGAAMEHYRSFRILVEDTRRIRISDSVAWHPTAITNDSFKCLLPTSMAPTKEITAPSPPVYVFEPVQVPTTLDTNVVPAFGPPTARENASVLITDARSIEPTFSSITHLKDVSQQDSQATTQESTTQDILPHTQLSVMSSQDLLPPSAPIIQPRRGERCMRPKKHFKMAVMKFCGIAHSYRSACKGPQKERWLNAGDEEFYRLLTETETMKFIPWREKQMAEGSPITTHKSELRSSMMARLNTESVVPMEATSRTMKAQHQPKLQIWSPSRSSLTP